MSNPSQNKPDADERQRAAQALELRTSGMTYAAIAAELKYSDESGPRKAVDRLLSRVECEGAEELRQLEGQRLDAMQRAIWPQACSGDLDAIKTVLTIMARRAKLLGLDAPANVAVGPSVSSVEFASEAARLIESIAALGGTDDLLRSLSAQPATTEIKDPSTQSDSVIAVYGVEMLPVDDDNWSNITGPGDEIVAPPAALTPQPDPVPEPLPDRSRSSRRRCSTIACPAGLAAPMTLCRLGVASGPSLS